MFEPHAPIGLFDSGVGGLTVLERVRTLLPSERLVYIADQANVPYGGRPLREIHGFATGLSNELIRLGCKAIVMACNVSSATALDDVTAANPDHVLLGVVVPGAAAAAAHTRTGHIGVLATAGTVASGAYPNSIARIDSTLKTTQIACPEFVPLVERGEVSGRLAERAARRYLEPLLEAGVDTIVLGCTHYPYLLGALHAVADRPVTFIDPAEHTARRLVEALTKKGLLATGTPPPHRLLTTGPLETFNAQLKEAVHDVDYVTTGLQLLHTKPNSGYGHSELR